MPSLRELCQQYKITFKKSLGQNLMLDENINRLMVDAAALTKDDDVLEVGAGLGALTDLLHKEAGRVLAIEIDRAFMPCLEDRFGAIDNVVLFRGDVLNHEMRKLFDEFLPGGTTFKVVANLPYYITAPLLFEFWESDVHFSRIVVMLQEEVALRLVAPVGNTDYSSLSVAARYYGHLDIIRKVPRTCFRPEPRVDSCIVRMRCHETPLFPDLERAYLMGIVRASFSQRRKTLRNSLGKSPFFAGKKELLPEIFEKAGVDPGARPQTLALEQFAAIARELRAR